MPTGENFATNVPQTQLASPIAAAATSVPVLSSSSWPAAPFTAIFGIGTSLQEAIYVTNVAGTTWTATRGYAGTVAQNQPLNQTITFGTVGQHFTEFRAHLDASGPTDTQGAAVHGLTSGVVVGTTQSQTLTNKTLTSPIINTPTGSGGTWSGGTFTSPTITTPTLNGSGGALTLPAGPDTLVARATTDTLTNKTISAGTFTGAQTMGSGAWSGSGSVSEVSLQATGKAGAVTNPIGLAGGTAGNPPSSGTFATGDMVWDASYNGVWLCTAGGTPGTWRPVGGGMTLGTTILGASSASIPINVPSWVRDIRGVFKIRQDSASGGAFATLRINGDSGNNYTWNYAYGHSAAMTTANSGGAVSFINIGITPGPTDTANYFGTGEFIMTDVNGSTFKSVSSSFQGPITVSNGYTGTAGGLWQSTAAITSITLLPSSGNFVAGSELSLYGMA